MARKTLCNNNKSGAQPRAGGADPGLIEKIYAPPKGIQKGTRNVIQNGTLLGAARIAKT